MSLGFTCIHGSQYTLLSVDRKKSIIESPWGRVYMGIRGRWRLEQGTEMEYIQLLHLQYSVCADFVSWPVGLSVANMGILRRTVKLGLSAGDFKASMIDEQGTRPSTS